MSKKASRNKRRKIRNHRRSTFTPGTSVRVNLEVWAGKRGVVLGTFDSLTPQGYNGHMYDYLVAFGKLEVACYHRELTRIRKL